MSYIGYTAGVMTRTLLAGLFLLAGCSANATSVEHEPLVSAVTFSPGCSAKTEAPSDCAFGFVLTYVKGYADLETTVTHATNNDAHTVEITVDTWSSAQVHEMSDVQPQDANLGLLDARVGQTYDVTVVDRNHAVLWTGKVDTIYHL